MQTKTKIAMAVTVVAALALGFIAGTRRNQDYLNVPVVRTYTLPAERVDDVKNQLNYLMPSGDGRAQAFANGLLIVRAPEGFQMGIHRLVDQLANAPNPPRNAIHIDYWLVTGQEEKASNAAEIQPLAKALEAITNIDGKRKFRVLEHLSSNSMASQEVKVVGSVSETRATAMFENDTVRAKVDFKSKLGSVQSETQLKPGEFLVLGQNGVATDEQLHGSKVVSGPANVYYIIRAELIK